MIDAADGVSAATTGPPRAGLLPVALVAAVAMDNADWPCVRAGFAVGLLLAIP